MTQDELAEDFNSKFDYSFTKATISQYENDRRTPEVSALLKLADYFNARPTLNYALSMWYENKYRKNDYISAWNGHIVTNEHYYFVGGHEKNRNSIIEALIVNC